MTPCVDHGRGGQRSGYATARLRINDKLIITTLHRKLYYEHTGELPEVVRHKCDNPRCINLEHLEAGSQKDNVRDMITRNRRGYTGCPGSSHGAARLDEAIVRYLRQMCIPDDSEWGYKAVAHRLGLAQSSVARAVRGLTWQHVK